MSTFFRSLSFTFWQKYLLTCNTHSFCTQLYNTQLSVLTIDFHSIVHTHNCLTDNRRAPNYNSILMDYLMLDIESTNYRTE